MVALNKFVTSEVGDVQMLFNNAGVAPAELQSIWDTNPNDWNWARGQCYGHCPRFTSFYT